MADFGFAYSLMNPPKLDPELKKAWVEGLRSGKYTQYFYPENGEDWFEEDSEDRPATHVCALELAHQVFITNANLPFFFIHLNDYYKWPFSVIADFIEAEM